MLEILCQPVAHNLEHAVEGLFGGPDGGKGIWCVQVIPVLEIRGGLEELRRQGEPDGSQIRDTNESVDTIVSTNTSSEVCNCRGGCCVGSCRRSLHSDVAAMLPDRL